MHCYCLHTATSFIIQSRQQNNFFDSKIKLYLVGDCISLVNIQSNRTVEVQNLLMSQTLHCSEDKTSSVLNQDNWFFLHAKSALFSKSFCSTKTIL